MAVSMSSGRVTADISGNVQTSGSQLSCITSHCGNGTTVLGTVPAGKVWKIYHYITKVFYCGSTAGLYSQLNFHNVAIDLVQTAAAAIAPPMVTSVGLGQNYFLMEETQEITNAINNSGIRTDVTVWYIEETA